jgi:hypothetical protein
MVSMECITQSIDRMYRHLLEYLELSPVYDIAWSIVMYVVLGWSTENAGILYFDFLRSVSPTKLVPIIFLSYYKLILNFVKSYLKKTELQVNCKFAKSYDRRTARKFGLRWKNYTQEIPIFRKHACIPQAVPFPIELSTQIFRRKVTYLFITKKNNLPIG